MISIETEYLPARIGQAHIRARAHGVTAVYLKAPAGIVAADQKSHLAAATKIAELAIPVEQPMDLVVRAVHVEPRTGFVVWIAFDRRKG